MFKSKTLYPHMRRRQQEHRDKKRCSRVCSIYSIQISATSATSDTNATKAGTVFDAPVYCPDFLI